MNKKVLIPVVALAVLAAGALVYFKAYDGGGSGDKEAGNLLVPTAAADVYEDSNRLEVSEGTVTVLRASGNEEEVTDETTVDVGDTITVSTDGKATLYWFDNSISRLAAGTEITIDQAAYNPENINETDISFEVVGGEVWSKVQAIVDEDSEFLGYAGNVVAGVRGSVFNFAVEGDMVVVDSIAHALRVGDETLTSGEQGGFDKESGEQNFKDDIPEERWGEAWFRDNLERDGADHQRMMTAMMAKLRKSIGALPGEPGFDDKMAALEKFMKSDASEAEKEAVKAKIVALVRALDVLPDDEMFKVRAMLQEKLIQWEQDEKTKAFLMKKRVERRLYSLYDWVQANDPTPEQVGEFLMKFRGMIGDENEFFHQNPELIRLVEKIIETLQDKMPGLMDDAEFLRVIDKINDGDGDEPVLQPEVSRSAPVRNIDTIKLLDVEPQDPPITTEPKDVIEEEAPFHRGESNV